MENEIINLSREHLKAKYKEYLLAAGLSQATIRGYLRNLYKFCGFLDANRITDFEKVDRQLFVDYQLLLARETNYWGRKNTVASQINLIKGATFFFNFLYDNDYLRKNPAKGIRYPRLPNRLPRNIITEAEASKILEQPNINTRFGFRDRTMLEVFYSTGIRHAELRKLEIPDVDIHSGSLLIREGKGGKDRYVPLGRVASQFLDNYIQHVRPFFLLDNPTNALFLSYKGKWIGKSALDFLVRKYANKAKIKKVVSCHTWRHACATHLVNRGMDIRHVQALLGHASLNTTQIYTRVAIDDLKRVIRKHHPREKQNRDLT